MAREISCLKAVLCQKAWNTQGLSRLFSSSSSAVHKRLKPHGFDGSKSHIPIIPFYKKGCSIKRDVKTNTSPATAKRREMVLPSSPSNGTRLCEFPFSVDSSCCRNDAVQFLTQTSRAVVQSQPWFYLRLFAYRFFWLSEGA